MRALVIGTGAAGNKAVINLLESGIILEEDTLLINSTLKDIPEKYRNNSVQLSQEYEGCGKERRIAKEITLDALKDGSLNILDLIKYEHEKVIIVTSMEGGTGSGSTPILADYCYNESEMNVEIYAFKGFEEDGRGLANSIEFFQDLQPCYGVQVIRNDAFLKEASGNIKKAQKLANDELVKRVRVSLGQVIVDSEDNVDDTDLYKVTNTAGYSTIEYLSVDDKIKSMEEFNKIISEMIDSSKSISVEKPSAQRLAIILNLQESSQENVDYSFKPIKDKLGEPYELFKHIQYDKKMEEFIAIIASGMKMPTEELKILNEKYKQKSNSIDKSEDNFYSVARSLVGNKEDSRYNMVKNRKRASNPNIANRSITNNNGKSDFFSKYDKAKKLGIYIMEEKEFLEYIKE